MEHEGLEYPFSIVHYFIPEFIVRMRKRREVLEKPSPRQAFAMCKLLVPAYMRKGKLSFVDLVEIAKYTTKVDDQDIAHMIAMEILLNPMSPPMRLNP